MQPVVSEKKYQFVPPYYGTIWPRILTMWGRRKLRHEYGIESVEVVGAERLRQSLAAGHGILLAPNHCRPCDPFVVAETCRQVGTLPFIMASTISSCKAVCRRFCFAGPERSVFIGKGLTGRRWRPASTF